MKALFSELRPALASTLVLGFVTCGVYPALVWGVSQVTFQREANGSLIADADGTLRGSRLIGQSFSSDKYFIPRPSSAGTGYDASSSSGSNLGPTSKKLLNGTVKGTLLAPAQPGGEWLPGPDVVEFDGLKLRALLYCEQNGLPYQLLQDGKPADAAPYKDAKGEFNQVQLIKAFNHDAQPDDKPLTIRASVPLPADAITGSGSGLDPNISPANARLQVARVARLRGLPASKVEELVAEHTEKPDLGLFGEPRVHVLRLNLALDGLK